MKCKKTMAKIDEKIRCPFCGHRIFVKMRPEVVKRVHAR
jgi:DNA-directed RNA polymerase subunit RPC12/RpoP